MKKDPQIKILHENDEDFVSIYSTHYKILKLNHELIGHWPYTDVKFCYLQYIFQGIISFTMLNGQVKNIILYKNIFWNFNKKFVWLSLYHPQIRALMILYKSNFNEFSNNFLWLIVHATLYLFFLHNYFKKTHVLKNFIQFWVHITCW